MPPATAALEHDYWSRTTRLKHRVLHGLPRYKLEIGDQIPVGIVAQLDIKMDDGSADAGIHQFAPFRQAISHLREAATPPACTCTAGLAEIWNVVKGVANDYGACCRRQI